MITNGDKDQMKSMKRPQTAMPLGMSVMERDDFLKKKMEVLEKLE